MSRRRLIWIVGLSLPVVFFLGVVVGVSEADREEVNSTNNMGATAGPSGAGVVGAPTSTTSTVRHETPEQSAGPSTTSPTVASAQVPKDWQTATVLEVVDGDTIDVRLEDGSLEPLRLIGTNSPESGECFYAEATAGLADLILGATVYLEPDQSNRDQFGRLLRYVWTADEQHVNAITVERGWAIAREYPPDTARSEELAVAQDRAKQAEAGLWAPDACGTVASVDVQIVHIEYDALGNDNFNLNGEWVEILNGDTTAVDLTGWVLKDESASHRYRFPDGFRLLPKATVLVYTGCGRDTATELYWCESGSAVWNNTGDSGFLLDPQGNVVWSYAYG